MSSECPTCEQIISLENKLDAHAATLAERVNEFCAPVRARNKERWEEFARYVNLPLVGNLIYRLLREPKGLEDDPSYYGLDWYKPIYDNIQRVAIRLEKMKASHLEHWGDEPVTALFPWDQDGYCARHHYHPENPMPRKDAYKTYNFEGKKERLLVFPAEKYDFLIVNSHSIYEGVFVLDELTKKVVPFGQCTKIGHHRRLWHRLLPREGIIDRITRYTARSEFSYTTAIHIPNQVIPHEDVPFISRNRTFFENATVAHHS